MALRSRPIPSIIQGVSQQTPQSRRDAQCEAQNDCFNSPRLGVVARPGMDFQALIGEQFPDAFVYELIRGEAEHYLMVLSNGTLHIYDLNTFTACSVTPLGGSTYLNSAVGVADRDNFRVQSVGDFTFIANLSIIPIMDPSVVQPTQRPGAIVFFQAGEYLTNYQVSVEYAGKLYTFTYQTPDNSIAFNAQFIATNQIAATFFRAMTGNLAVSGGSGTTVGSAGLQGAVGNNYTSGAGGGNVFLGGTFNGSVAGTVLTVASTNNGFLPIAVGDTLTTGTLYTAVVGSFGTGTGGVGTYNMSPSGTVAGPNVFTVTPAAPITLISLGFTISIDGNLILIQRASDNNPFTVDATDGTGDDAISVIQDEIQSTSRLPKGGFQGYTVKVDGVEGLGSTAAFFVAFNRNVSAGGAWLECPAPGLTTQFLNSTMPLTIFCSAVDTFEVTQPAWTHRLGGDGVFSTLQPGFVGQFIQDLGYINGRLAIVTESTYDLSQPNNVFNWWPNSAQVVEESDPISGQVAASETTALLRRAAVIDESFTLWAQRAQFRVNSGVNPFTSQFILDPETTTYEFNAACGFAKTGTSLYFSYEADLFATVYNLQYSGGRPTGNTEATSHVQEYIPAGVRGIAPSTPLKLLFVRTDGNGGNQLYLYNWLAQGDTIEQSAWNVWNLPAGQILWHTVYNQFLYVLLQRPEGAVFLTCPLNMAHVDPGGKYLTRLDLRLSETEVTPTFNAGANTTTIAFPMTLSTAEQAALRVVIRTSDLTPHLRGSALNIVSTTANSVTVSGNVSTSQFYLGLAIVSTRVESPFYIRTATGHIPTEELVIRVFELDYANTGYTRIEVDNSQTGASYSLADLGGGDLTQVLGVLALQAGQMRVVIDGDALAVTITCINDTPFPSQWTASAYEYESVERATPLLTPYGGPVQ